MSGAISTPHSARGRAALAHTEQLRVVPLLGGLALLRDLAQLGYRTGEIEQLSSAGAR